MLKSCCYPSSEVRGGSDPNALIHYFGQLEGRVSGSPSYSL